jgi:hypothetical protein
LRIGLAVLTLLFMAIPSQAQERPLEIDTPGIIGTGRVRANIGVTYLHGQRYPLSGLTGNLVRLGVASFRFGVGDIAEFQISGVIQDFLTIGSRTQPMIPLTFHGNTTHDFGDLVMATKLRLLAETRRRPALAFKFEVELPDASDASGLGNNETEFYSRLLLGKYLGRAHVFGELGLGILGNPAVATAQADVATYGAGITMPIHPRIELVAGLDGQQGHEDKGNKNRAKVRAGIRFRTAGLRCDVAGIAGLRAFDARYGLSVGVTYEFQAFGKSLQTAWTR